MTQRIFGMSKFDQHCACNPQISAQQISALKSFCDDLVGLVSKNFEAYIRGTSIKKPILRRKEKEFSNKENNVPISIFKQSYTSNAKINNYPTSKAFYQTKEKNLINPKKQLGTTPDERLFFRIPEDSLLRTYTGYAVQTFIKEKL